MKLLIAILGLLILFGLIYIQINLSKKSNKYYGIILPIVCLVLSLSYSLIGTPNKIEIETDQEIHVVDEDEMVHLEKNSSVETEQIEGYSSSLITTLILSNVITLILITIYVYQRIQINKRKQLLIMKANDL